MADQEQPPVHDVAEISDGLLELKAAIASREDQTRHEGK